MSRIRVRAHDTKGYRYFELTRVDGTSDDVFPQVRLCVVSRVRKRRAPRHEAAGGAVGAARRALLTSLILEQTSVRGVLRAETRGGRRGARRAARRKQTIMRRDDDTRRGGRKRSAFGELSRGDDAHQYARERRLWRPAVRKVPEERLCARRSTTCVAAALVKIARLTRDGGGDAGAEARGERDERGRDDRLASSETYAALVETARGMCVDGRFDARATANAIHAVAKTFAAEPSRQSHFSKNSFSHGDEDVSAVSARDALPANVYRLVAALEARVVDVARDMTPQAVANALWGFATARWELGEESWQALQAQTARCGEGTTANGENERERDLSAGNQQRKGSRNERKEERNAFNAQESANVVGVGSGGPRITPPGLV